MDENQNSKPLDDGETNSTWNNAPIMHQQSTMQPVDQGVSSRKIITGCLVTVGIIGVCLVLAAGMALLLPNTPLFARFLPSATPTFTPTFTSTPTLTPSPTNTPTPTPNMIATQRVLNVTNTAQAFQSKATSAASDWNIVLADNFDSNKNGWGIESTDGERAKSLITVADGKYSWDISTYKLDIHWETANTQSLGDFIVSVDAKQSGGPSTGEIGLTFREDDNYFDYYFGINNQGEYFLFIYYDEWITLIDYTASELIIPNEYNRLTVIGEGSHFTFFINGQYITEFTDERIQNGNVGLFSMLYQANQQATFEFDNFELRAP